MYIRKSIKHRTAHSFGSPDAKVKNDRREMVRKGKAMCSWVRGNKKIETNLRACSKESARIEISLIISNE